MTSLPYDQYKAAYDATKSAWWDEIDARARKMVADGLTLEEFAKVQYGEVKWAPYSGTLLCLFLHYNEKKRAMSDLSGQQ